MPSKNILKIDIPDTYYHVYARGSSRRDIFLDPKDKQVFLNLFKRYLSPKNSLDRLGQPYPNYSKDIELLCYCLMDNHFHLLIYQVDQGFMSMLMRGIMTSYSRYFNKKYNQSGPLFESRYKASMIDADDYLTHITRYIHLNPKDWRKYDFSSLQYYTGKLTSDWLHPQKVLDLFASKTDYLEFVADYEDYKESLDNIKYQLANN